MQDDYELPSPGQEIVKVVRSCGNNLHEVEKPEPESTKYLGKLFFFQSKVYYH